MTETTAPAERLPESASLLLDGMRFALALIVVVGHLSAPYFSYCWPPLLGYADAAVPAFFVLSGFVIRYVTQDRERDPRRYFISRAARMYSVVVPAILLTLGCDAIMHRLDPRYATALFHEEGARATASHVLAHLLFYTQPWGHAVLLPPNLPLWSLGYEVPYYLFFGLLMLCRGRWRWGVAAAYTVLLGPQVLFLLPLWWSGCWLYGVWQWARRDGVRTVRMAGTALAAAFLLLGMLLPWHGEALWLRIARCTDPLTWVHQSHTRASMLAYASGIVAWLAMLLGLIASDQVTLRRNAAWARPVRRLADGTFTLYLFHFPLLCLAVPLLGHPLHTEAEMWITFLIVTLICVAAAVPVDWLKTQIRRSLSTHFTPSGTTLRRTS